jgi:Rps23 Pro-64 3,4-dihydroxylase Tpa1-like proline 4-hydroxylase
MDIKCGDIGFPYIEIENFYTSEELNLIWEEIDFLYYDHKIERSTGSAKMSGKPLKSNRCIYLDELYKQNRHLSNILTLNRKLYSNNFKLFKSHKSWFFQSVQGTSDYTAFSFYENGDHYLPHKDAYYITSLFWTFKEPKKFVGGDFVFSQYDHKIEVQNNKMLIFPSQITHHVTPVLMDNEYCNQKMGRVCISHFLQVVKN